MDKTKTSTISSQLLVIFVFILSLNTCQCQIFSPHYNNQYKISSFKPLDRPTCEPITIDVCKDMAYNQTVMPNIFNHQSQKDAQEEVNTFSSLIYFNCSPYLKIFICTLYAPICTDQYFFITPCKSLCEEVKQSCEKDMNRFQYQWPVSWNCSQFNIPTCVGENKTQLLKDLNRRQPDSRFKNNTNGHLNPYDRYNENKAMSLQCLPKMKVPKNYQYDLRIRKSKIKDCGVPCSADSDSLFGPDKKIFAWYMVGTASIICLISTLFTLITFLVDMDRFPYPERPIIFLSGCYLAVSVAFIIGFFTGENVACVGPFSSQEFSQDQQSMPKIVVQGTKKELCTIVFMVLYYFGMASSLWWVMLTITWFLSASLKWGQEALDRNSQYFHLIAWSLPAIQTIAILGLGKVEGDNLVGVCYVGVQDENALVIFVIIPLVVYLSIGIFFLMAGLISLFRIRSVMKLEGTCTEKLEKLMLRIGVFSLLYTVPAGIVVACHFYELMLRSDWMLAWYTKTCHKYNYPSCPWPMIRKSDESDATSSAFPDISDEVGNQHLRELQRLNMDFNFINFGGNGGVENFFGNVFYLPTPDFTIFMIKYVMMLIVGICSGFWVWSGKTILSFHRKICCCCYNDEKDGKDKCVSNINNNYNNNFNRAIGYGNQNNFYTGLTGKELEVNLSKV